MTDPLDAHERAYRALAAQMAAELGTIGFISAGSVVTRYTTCGKPGCRCIADPPARHGPYHQWSRAVGGKTVTRRLTGPQADLYRQWIANRRRLEAIITRMEQVSTAAGELLLDKAAPAKTQTAPKP